MVNSIVAVQVSDTQQKLRYSDPAAGYTIIQCQKSESTEE